MAQGKAWDKEKILEALKPYLQLGYSVNRACILAQITNSTIWTWIEREPELRVKIRSWQNMVSAKSREVIVKSIQANNKEDAKWWLERREKKSFSTRTETKQEGAVKVDLSEETKKRIAEFKPKPSVKGKTDNRLKQ